MAYDPIEGLKRQHADWIGMLQPVGLVATAAALVDAQASVHPHRQAEASQWLRGALGEGDEAQAVPLREALVALAEWVPGDWVESPEALGVHLGGVGLQEGEWVQPSFSVPGEGDVAARLVALELPLGQALDEGYGEWEAVSPQARLERVMRQHGVALGLLSNQQSLRLVVAPVGEASGHLTWNWADLARPEGRPMLGGFFALLHRGAFFGPDSGRLEKVVADSRRYQSRVSTQLAGQVQQALSELLDGFQEADTRLEGALLQPWLAAEPGLVYEGLLAVLMRLVFVLYAEERGLMPEGELYAQHYSVGALAKELEDRALAGPELLNHSHGAWPRLLALFQMVHQGALHRVREGGNATRMLLHMPARQGRLFHPDSFRFLRGYTVAERWPEHLPEAPERQKAPALGCPQVPDRAVHAVLQALTRLGHERLSYRALDVEQIGAVYEAMMGFEVKLCAGESVALEANWPGMKGQKLRLRLDVEALLALPGGKRKAWVEEAGLRWAKGLEGAQSSAEVLEALKLKQGGLEGPGRCYLAPTQKRRATGSHYTPGSLTRPIVEKALEPPLAALGPKPRPEQILALKVLDPAMGSGAFLVAATRVLGDLLVQAWLDHPEAAPKSLPANEDRTTLARRMVAERCLYGVDVNPVAVDLAKLSLWLATLAKDQPFTFLDHALQTGDALAGLTPMQLHALHWVPEAQEKDWWLRPLFQKALKKAAGKRREIQALAGQSTETDGEEQRDITSRKAKLLAQANLESERFVRFADGLVACFFAEAKPKEREARRGAWLQAWQAHVNEASPTPEPEGLPLPLQPEGAGRLRPLQWPLAFPEVFPSVWGEKGEDGFDAVVGNPPFMGHVTAADSHVANYTELLREIHADTGGKTDLIAHFFRRAFTLAKQQGAIGLISTNTIAQGDTRSSSLEPILRNQGHIYSARRRMVWPGAATVVVSVIHIIKSDRYKSIAILDGKPVSRISAYLTQGNADKNPASLICNASTAFQGSVVVGMGFTFDDSNPKANPDSLRIKMLDENQSISKYIKKYIGGEELNTDPRQQASRWIIDLGTMNEEMVRSLPSIYELLKIKVYPERIGSTSKSNQDRLKGKWWQYFHVAHELYEATDLLPRFLATARVSAQHAFAWLIPGMVTSDALVVFALAEDAALALLQGRLHEHWAHFFGSSLEDRARYTPSTCFETFPFPEHWREHPRLNAAGAAYHAFRAELMTRTNLGLTKTYNRFHDRHEDAPEILELRRLHNELDAACFAAYGWNDLLAWPEDQAYAWRARHEGEEEEELEPGAKPKKKAERYTFTPELEAEVFGRLLALNAERAAAEAAAGPVAKVVGEKGKRGRPPKNIAPEPTVVQPSLFT